MSLKEAYTLAHTAQCRLNMEASRPDRNLRFVVGHLMHYESLRLRIVEIEHDISSSERARAVQFRGTGHANHRLKHKPSTGSLRRRSPSPPPPPAEHREYAGLDDLPDDIEEDDEDEEGLSLMRFPSGSARPPQPPPDLEPDDSAEDDEDYEGPTSPTETHRTTLEHAMKGQSKDVLAKTYDVDEESSLPAEPDPAALERAMKGGPNEMLAVMYERVRQCRCNVSDAPAIERIWEMGGEEYGRTRAVVQVAD